MEINLNLISSDSLSLILNKKNINKNRDKIEKSQKSLTIKEINENIIREKIKNVFPHLKDLIYKEYYDIEIKKDNNKINCILVYIKSTNILIQELEKEINICREKENIIEEKQKQLMSKVENINIDKNLFLKKLYSLIDNKEENYDILINQIAQAVLDITSLNNQLNDIQSQLIKYRNSNVIRLFFKIYLIKIKKLVNYFHHKCILFLNNRELFNIIIESLPKLIERIFDEIIDLVRKGISSTNIYNKNKDEYNIKFKTIKKIFVLFPLLMFFDKRQEKIDYLFDYEKNIILNISENNYEKELENKKHIPQKVGLDIPLKQFHDINLNAKVLEAVIRRDFEIFQKYNSDYLDFMFSSFLFD